MDKAPPFAKADQSSTARHHILVLPPFAPLGQEAQYFWVLQKWLHDFAGESTTVVMPRFYMDRFEALTGWEFDHKIARQNHYAPVRSVPEAVKRVFYDDEQIRLGRRDSSYARFRDSVTEPNENFVAFYRNLLAEVKASNDGEPVCIAWVNNPSLRVAASAIDCPVIFAELGPLRAPTYAFTAYWDQAGVNGATDTTRLWSEEKADFAIWLAAQEPGEIRAWVRQKMVVAGMQEAVSSDDEYFDVGVALQIETDSNLLAYSRGWTNLALVEHIRRDPEIRQHVIKYHPHGKALYEGPVWANGSATSFLSSVSKICTINSSMGMEAALWGKDVEIFGDSPFLGYFEEDAAGRDLFVAWFFLRYLMPYELVFCAAYHDWRLSGPACGEIAERHLAYYAEPPKWTDSRGAEDVPASDAYTYFGPLSDLIPR